MVFIYLTLFYLLLISLNIFCAYLFNKYVDSLIPRYPAYKRQIESMRCSRQMLLDVWLIPLFIPIIGFTILASNLSELEPHPFSKFVRKFFPEY